MITRRMGLLWWSVAAVALSLNLNTASAQETAEDLEKRIEQLTDEEKLFVAVNSIHLERVIGLLNLSHEFRVSNTVWTLLQERKSRVDDSFADL